MLMTQCRHVIVGRRKTSENARKRLKSFEIARRPKGPKIFKWGTRGGNSERGARAAAASANAGAAYSTSLAQNNIENYRSYRGHPSYSKIIQIQAILAIFRHCEIFTNRPTEAVAPIWLQLGGGTASTLAH